MNRIVEFALKQRAFILIMLLVVFAAGAASFMRLNIEAYPDPVPPSVDIITQNSGQSAEEMERYVTVPIEVEIRNRAGKRQSVKRKVFPGYVLIEMVLDEETWHLVRSTTGVTGFVSSGNKPVPLQDKEVQNPH